MRARPDLTGRNVSAMMVLTILAVLCLFTAPATAFGLDVPRLAGRVNDYGGMISPQVRATLDAELAALERTDSTQVVILTVPSLEGDVIEEFSIRVGDAWKIGQKGKDNGVIFIVSKADRKMRIEVGRGLQGVLTDLSAGRIIDTVVKPRFKQGNFDDGFLIGTRAIIAATRGEYTSAAKSAPYTISDLKQYLWAVVFVVVLVLPYLRRINRFLPVPAGAAGGPIVHQLFSGGAASATTLGILAVVGAAVGLFVSAMGGGGNSGRKHGHHAGGSFWDSIGGSSWSSGGGGGSDFGGGGGSFDGGGSSGDW